MILIVFLWLIAPVFLIPGLIILYARHNKLKQQNIGLQSKLFVFYQKGLLSQDDYIHLTSPTIPIPQQVVGAQQSMEPRPSVEPQQFTDPSGVPAQQVMAHKTKQSIQLFNLFKSTQAFMLFWKEAAP